MINLGARVKDTITGFEGIAVSRVEHLYGCVRYSVQPTKLNKDGKPIENEWFDEAGLEVLVKKAVATSQETPPAGPGNDPPSRGM